MLQIPGNKKVQEVELLERIWTQISQVRKNKEVLEVEAVG
jgi:hypothetical protein